MSCSKPLPPFVCDSLYYLNRNKLEHFSIVCRPIKNFINRYFHSKPYRVFDSLDICGGSYALVHNGVQWHPNRDDFSVQQFLAGQDLCIVYEYFSFGEMHPYLSPAIRIKLTAIYEARDHIFSPEHIEQMESISYLSRDQEICITSDRTDSRIDANNFQQIFNSPTILQCHTLNMQKAHFSFKDYGVLYSVKVMKVVYHYKQKIDLENKPQYWQQFLEQPGVKPVVVFYCFPADLNLIIDRLSKAFSSAVVPNAFKIVFAQCREILTEFRETNKILGEMLELKKGLPAEFQTEYSELYENYTLERSII